ncbi:aminopeptidase N [Candidatus Rickettsiella isopodorum]|jgi:aminopeptidase N|uniref:Aminopeptidase N n=1 Tax=Candidatus Rickettsiella isopodorum TaxID=1225476 RepID=A0A1J8NKK6_9COXI|nr:aminopeptidase N [Candidatus Rickettsiella isopodorum]OIZ95953.1 aminopeptidase N [Candidatus Rickettsiella isopodorum]
MTELKTTFLKDYTPPSFLINRVELTFKLNENLTQVNSRLALTRNSISENKNKPLVLQGENCELIFIKLDARLLSNSDYQLKDNELIIFHVPDQFNLEIENRIKPKENTALSGLYVSRGIFCTQCEAEGFRRITYFLDRPDVLARYTTTIIADKKKYPILLSNGNKITQQDLENNQHSVTWEDPFKKPSYLFALVAGDLEYSQNEFVTQSQRKINLQIFSEKGEKNKCHHAMESLKKAMRWDEQAYGREYDLDIFMIAVIDDFNMGAMENKGLNIFNAQTILADPSSATDVDYSYITKVVGHEYFHNWTGNRITCRDWFQLSLKEGLTVFREQEFSESIGNPATERINTVRQLRAMQFAEDAGPLAHPVQPDSYIEINNFYTMTVYEKGAEIIRMMKVLVDPELFRKGMDDYFTVHDGQAVTIEDFVKSIEKGSGYDLQQFRRWYKQSGTPELQVDYHYSPEEKTFDLILKQHCPATPGQPTKKPFYIPLVMALFNPAGQAIDLQLVGDDTPLGTQCTLKLRESEHVFQFVNVDVKPIPSLLRNFSAPVKLKVKYSDKDLAFLMQSDTDGFNRWDAAQELASRIVLRRIQSSSTLEDSAVSELFKGYKILFAEDKQDSKDLLAELLSLPSEAAFAEQMLIIDIDGIHEEREWLRFQCAKKLENNFLHCYQACHDLKPYVFDKQSVTNRRLANISLTYLMLLQDPNVHHLCVNHYKKADNLTDRIVALSEIVNHNLSQRDRFLKEFYEKNSANSLVVCKWLAIQARAPLPDTLHQVKKLLKHPAFDWKNPNKIRSLIGVFCSENRSQFHDRSGAGYVFLSEQIQHLDLINPQIAARLVKPFTQWKRFDVDRQALMHEQLEKLIKIQGLSSDVYEMVSKSLL